MEMIKKTVTFKRNKKGVPCIWERSKIFPNMKRISCVFNPNGDRKESLASRIGSTDSLVPIENGDLFLKVFFDDDGVGVSILRFTDISPYSNKAEVEVVKRRNSGSDIWQENELAVQLSKETFKEISKVIEKIITN